MSGPAWQPAQWRRAAARAGLALPAQGADVVAGATVTIVGQRSVGDVDAHLAAQARALADEAGVDLLEVRFAGRDAGAAFASACPWPPLEGNELIGAVADYFAGRPEPPVWRAS